ncbi:MAG: PAS domain S-box protein [Elusimicrobiota bacterium]
MRAKGKKNKPEVTVYCKNIIDSLREPVLVLNKALEIVSANRAFCSKFNISEKEILGKSFNEIGNKQWNIPEFLTLLKKILPGKEIIKDYKVTREFENIGRRTLHLNAYKLRRPKEPVTEKKELILLTIEDITEQSRERESLEKSEERYRRAFETSKDGLLLFNKTKGNILESNESARDLLGYTEDEFLEKKIWEMGVTEDSEDFKEVMKSLERDGIFNYSDIKVRTKDGTKIAADVFLVDRAKVAQCNIREITEKKNVQKKLRESVEKYRKLTENINDIITLTDREGNILHGNKSPYKEILGYDIKNILGENVFKYFHPEDRNKVVKKFKKALVSKKGRVKARYRCKDGSYKWLESSGRVLGKEKFLVVSRDISRQKMMEEKIRESEEKYRNLFEGTRDALMLLDREGFLDCNKQTLKIFGFESIDNFINYTPWELSPETQPDGTASKQAAQKYMETAFKVGETFFEWIHKRSDGTEFPAEVKLSRFRLEGKPVLSALVRDITERKKAEEKREKLQEQLLQSQKMDAIGKLTGGVAHDFNNIITAIKMRAQMLLEEDLPDEIKKDLREIDKSSDRSKNLTKQLLQFSRKTTEIKDIINLNTVIENTLNMLERTIPEDIDITAKLDDKLMKIKAAPSTMEQVIMNLAINARDAMPEGGKISIKTENIEVIANKLPVPEIEPGKYVELTVKDNGSGMKDDIKDKIFDPFFTTKGVAKNTGMGLSVAYGVVKSCKGGIKVDSTVNEGTGIKIFLPVAEEKVKQPEKAKIKTRENKEFSAEGLGVLVIEDEESVRETVRKIFKKMGFKIYTAATAGAAREVFKKNRENIDIIFADIILPDGNGVEVSENLRDLKNSLQIVATSGYMSDKIDREDIYKKDFKFMEKPFSIEKVRKIFTGLTAEIKNR